MESKNIWAVIPAYNASKTLKKVVDDLKKYAPGLGILVVDDGSTDSTGDVARKLNVTLIKHNRNLGKGAALKRGFAAALSKGAELIVTMDADAQHNPRDIHRLLAKMRTDNLDLVIGSRMSNTTNMPLHRIASNKITSKLISWRLGQKIEDSQCGFRAIQANLIKNVPLESDKFDMESELIIKSGLRGFKIGSAAVETIYAKGGSSAMNWITDTFRFIKLLIRSFFWQ